MELLLPILSIAILIYSSILHEIAHGYIAYRLGDPTAKILGRITLNPVPHIDPFMSILIPLLTYLGSAGTFIFGGAKPVPVDPFNLRDGMKDLALVSLAGSKLFALLLPDKAAASYLAIGNSGLGMFILIALFFFPIGGFSLSSVIFTLITYSRSFLGF